MSSSLYDLLIFFTIPRRVHDIRRNFRRKIDNILNFLLSANVIEKKGKYYVLNKSFPLILSSIKVNDLEKYCQINGQGVVISSRNIDKIQIISRSYSTKISEKDIRCRGSMIDFNIIFERIDKISFNDTLFTSIYLPFPSLELSIIIEGIKRMIVFESNISHIVPFYREKEIEINDNIFKWMMVKPGFYGAILR